MFSGELGLAGGDVKALEAVWIRTASAGLSARSRARVRVPEAPREYVPPRERARARPPPVPRRDSTSSTSRSSTLRAWSVSPAARWQRAASSPRCLRAALSRTGVTAAACSSSRPAVSSAPRALAAAAAASTSAATAALGRLLASARCGARSSGRDSACEPRVCGTAPRRRGGPVDSRCDQRMREADSIPFDSDDLRRRRLPRARSRRPARCAQP